MRSQRESLPLRLLPVKDVLLIQLRHCVLWHSAHLLHTNGYLGYLSDQEHPLAAFNRIDQGCGMLSFGRGLNTGHENCNHPVKMLVEDAGKSISFHIQRVGFTPRRIPTSCKKRGKIF